MKIKLEKLTVKQEGERDEYLALKYLERSKVKGDYWWRMADQIRGDGDHTAADEGEPPQTRTYD